MKSLARSAVALCGLLAIGGSFAAAQDLPTTWSWTSTGPVVTAKPSSIKDIVSVKDASTVYYNGQYIIYATYADTAGGWGIQYLHFTNWSDANSVTPYFMSQNPNFGGYHTAPQVFYFAPQNKWYLIFQSGQPQYSTNSDATQPQNWTAPTNFFSQNPPPGVSSGWLDYWVICDSANCYLFFCDDGGQFYRSSTPIGNFPNGFNDPVVVYSEANSGNLFEADNVYTVAGTGEYLANVECIGPNGHRFFRALWASSLGGTWQPLGNTLNFSTPFLGMDNVTFDSGVGQWTDDFSSGGAVIVGADQTDTIDLNNFEFVYQGVSPNENASSYSQIPYALGVATYTGGGGTCNPTAIVPEMNVGGVWTQESSASVSSTTAVVDLGPQPLTGGSWAWTGPNGFTSTAREIDTIELSAGANVYTATYTNSCGAKSTQAFTITVTGGSTGSFSLKASAATLSVAQGASATDTITVTDVSPFTGSVTLAASGLPSGVTAAFATNPATATSVLTLTASSSAAAGASTVTITGTSGSLNATTTVALTVTSSSCTATAIVPEMNVGGVWTQESSATVTSTTAVVDLGPQPATGGTWAWTGPNGFTSTAREIDSIKLSTGANVYTATYTNASGCKSTQAFTITVSGGTTTLIANGTYIVTAVNSGSALDDPNSSTTNGTDMIIWAVNDGTNQQWKVNNVSTNVITLTNVASGQLLDVAGASKTSGALVDQWPANGQTNQEWTVISVSGGFELTSVNSGLALSVVGGGTANSTGVDQLTYSGATSQQWKFTAY